MESKEDLLKFLKSQRLLVIASSENNDTWICNVFYGVDENCKLYFISDEETKHSEQIMKNSNVAFSVAWFNEKDHTDKKAVQGKGDCRIATSDQEIKKGVELHNKYFPGFADTITVDWVKSKDHKSHVWVITPNYIKYWDDELYGDEETEEFSF